MKVIFNGEPLDFSDEPFSIKKLEARINEIIDNGLILSYVEIDGSIMYEDYYDFIRENQNTIGTVQVVFKTKKEFLDDMLLTAKNYLADAKPRLSELSKEFYQGPTKDSWYTLEQLLEALGWFAQFMHQMEINKGMYASWESSFLIAFDFRELLESLHQGVASADPILIGDVLNYELIPMMNRLEEQVIITIDHEVALNEFN